MKKILDKLCNQYSIDLVEKHLFHYYLHVKNLKIKDSKILKSYFKDFCLIEDLFLEISKIDVKSFENLEKSQELLIPKLDRSLNGAFFTPRLIVNKIIEELKPQKSNLCCDLSCGGGAFIIGLIKYYQKNFNKSINNILKSNIYGYDLLEYNIVRTKIIITIYALEHDEIVIEESFNLKNCDSLKEKFNIRFDIIVGNPPYVKFQDMDEKLRSYLFNNFESINKGTYNLYFSFFELGYCLLSENGKLGYITPNNYFTSLSAEPLRKFFSKHNSIFKVIDFNSKKVFDVLTYTCLTFLSKKPNKSILFNKYFNGDFDLFIESFNKDLSEVFYKDLKDKKWRLLLNKDQKNIKNIENIGIKLSDLFTINVGIATLKDELYFIDGVDSEGFYKLLNNIKYYIESDLVKSIYKISDFDNQKECDINLKKIIFPYRVFNNKSSIILEQDLQQIYPNTFKYFKKIKNELLERAKENTLNPFYIYGRSQGLNKFGIRLLTPTFSQKPKFLKVIEKDSLYCNGYGLHYNIDQNKATLFDNKPIQNPARIDLLQRILNSIVMHYYVSTTSVSIDGGYPCYQKNFIELFTIPDLSETQLDELSKLDSYNFNSKLIEIYDLNLEL